MRKCPYCKNDIPAESIECEYCGNEIDNSSPRCESCAAPISTITLICNACGAVQGSKREKPPIAPEGTWRQEKSSHAANVSGATEGAWRQEKSSHAANVSGATESAWRQEKSNNDSGDMFGYVSGCGSLILYIGALFIAGVVALAVIKWAFNMVF